MSTNSGSDPATPVAGPLYPGGPTHYERVPVPANLVKLVGTWEGPFRSHDPQVNEFRPFWNDLVYRQDMCFRLIGDDPGNGDIFLLGTKTYTYPAFRASNGQVLPQKIDKGYLVYGMKGDDATRLFLRTVDSDANTVQYDLVYQHEPTGTTVFRNSGPATDGNPPSFIDIVGWNNPTTDDNDAHLLGVSLTIGSLENPTWQGMVSGGKQYHRPPVELDTPAPPRKLDVVSANRLMVADESSPNLTEVMKMVVARTDLRRKLHSMCTTIPLR